MCMPGVPLENTAAFSQSSRRAARWQHTGRGTRRHDWPQRLVASGSKRSSAPTQLFAGLLLTGLLQLLLAGLGCGGRETFAGGQRQPPQVRPGQWWRQSDVAVVVSSRRLAAAPAAESDLLEAAAAAAAAAVARPNVSEGSENEQVASNTSEANVQEAQQFLNDFITAVYQKQLPEAEQWLKNSTPRSAANASAPASNVSVEQTVAALLSSTATWMAVVGSQTLNTSMDSASALGDALQNGLRDVMSFKNGPFGFDASNMTMPFMFVFNVSNITAPFVFNGSKYVNVTVETLNESLYDTKAEVLDPRVHGTAAAPDGKKRKGVGVAVYSSCARRVGDDWLLPLEVRLYRRNEERHTILLALCRRVLFNMICGIDDIDSEGIRLYNERARLIFRSLEVSREVRNRTLKVRIYTGEKAAEDDVAAPVWRKLPPTNKFGHIGTKIAVPVEEVEKAAQRENGRVAVEVDFEEFDTGLGPASTTVIQLLEDEGLSVISDIDDTVKVTEVFRGKQALLRNTFLRQFRAVEGMAEVYNAWEKEHDARFHYVSKSPPEFHDTLKEFLEVEGFPNASLHLCALWDPDREDFKRRRIESILADFPKRKFVLVGDSGERDPTIYADIARRHPKRIVKVIIREVAETRPVDAKIFRGISRRKWQVFRDAAEITLPQLPGRSWVQALFGWMMPKKEPTSAASDSNADIEDGQDEEEEEEEDDDDEDEEEEEKKDRA
eukprot:TRINITY_DN3314_c0_g1_i1.p1 TRINITY_DN3314_c0_g1~~TRINITY_DN3314_c0_g1_i1.p1  ORF type:complete len:723 (+),score=208.28 TRINITY_DN3314_c0_g1_i1:71-2239(+)